MANGGGWWYNKAINQCIMYKKSEAGYLSRTLMILAFVVLLAVVLVYGLLKYAGVQKAAQVAKDEAGLNEPPKPVYEATVGDIRFLFDSAIDLGAIIKAETLYQQDIFTTEKFIKVTVRAQNKGKIDTTPYAWEMGNIIDSEGRNFIADPNAYPFLPRPDSCGTALKPEFEPTPCVKIYQVSKASTNLKIQVSSTSAGSSKKQEAFLDLNVR